MLVSIFALNLGIIFISSYYKIEIPVLIHSSTVIIMLPFLKYEVNRIIQKVYNCKDKIEFWKRQENKFIVKLKELNIDAFNKEQIIMNP